MRTLLLVGVGRTGRPYIAAARRLGVRVCAVELPERCGPIADQVNELVECRGAADELWAEAALIAARRHQPDGVIAFSEPQVMAAALIQDEYGLPGPSLGAATISRNKGLQRGRFAAAGIGQPAYVVVDRLSEARDWVIDRFPVVVKPLSSAGSAGVELVPDLTAFTAAAARRDGAGRLLAEQAVAGPEYSWEALVRDGQVWLANTTAKETTGPPHFVEVAHQMPAELSGDAAAQVSALGAAVIEAIGMRTGIVHLEFRLGASGPAVMEIAVRTPGDRLMDLLGLVHGIDWFECVVRLALGLDLPQLPRQPIRHAAVYLPVARAGTVEAVGGLDRARAGPCFVSAEILVAPGHQVEQTRSSGDRVGEVLLAGPEQAGVREALAEVRRTLVIHMADTAGELAAPAVS